MTSSCILRLGSIFIRHLGDGKSVVQQGGQFIRTHKVPTEPPFSCTIHQRETTCHFTPQDFVSNQNNTHLLHLCHYIHGNPVKDGLVANPADWHYSNYLDWIAERNGSLPDRDFIQHQFGSAQEYKKSLFLYLKTLDLPDDVKKFLDDLEK
jgi:hypothetical protein